MPRFCRAVPRVLVAGILLATSVAGQSQAPAVVPKRASYASATAITVRSVSIVQAGDGVAVAIASNGALVPAITKLDGPPRLVIDLAGAVNATTRARVKGSGPDIKSVRVSQYQQNPPLTRVVVDLSAPRNYTWETVQNKLLVHLKVPGASEQKAGASAPAFTQGVEPAITYASAAPRGTVRQVNQQASGPSSVTAAEESTILNLARGGQIRVCPGTTISVTSSGDKRDVMVGMSTGSFEVHYGLTDSADSVLTPDFRILLPGPGQFDLAISADSRGNTCVRSLHGNTAPAVVSELMGDGVYQVKADERVVFHNGQLAKADQNVPIDCGCPPAQTPILRTEAPPPPAPETASAGNGGRPEVGDQIPANGGDGRGVAVRMSVTAPDLSAAVVKPSEIHMQVDAPLVFRGNEEPRPAPTEEARNLPVTAIPRQALTIVPLPPPTASAPNAAPAKPRSGFFRRFKHLLSSMFG